MFPFLSEIFRHSRDKNGSSNHIDSAVEDISIPPPDIPILRLPEVRPQNEDNQCERAGSDNETTQLGKENEAEKHRRGPSLSTAPGSAFGSKASKESAFSVGSHPNSVTHAPVDPLQNVCGESASSTVAGTFSANSSEVAAPFARKESEAGPGDEIAAVTSAETLLQNGTNAPGTAWKAEKTNNNLS